MGIRERILVSGGSGFIGANLIESLQVAGRAEILNLDIHPPKEPSQKQYWKACDLLDAEVLARLVREFAPVQVVHLAARTDMFGQTVDDYTANYFGTANLATAIRHVPSVKRAVFTSSQFVVGPGALPKDDFDFRPHTVYGESKVRSEKAVRDARLECTWTIIRPTNIWGKWHPRYPTEFWKVVRDGRYIHPGGGRVVRCYGYVGNVIEQIEGILSAESARVAGKVFYVGDPPIDLIEWTNAFSMELRGSKVRVVPRAALAGLAKVGDLVNAIGGSFPIFSSRFRSMTESYVTPMEPTFAVLGRPRISLEEGVRATGQWLRGLGPAWN